MKRFCILTLFLLATILIFAQNNGSFLNKRFIRPEIRIGHTFEGLFGNTVLFPEDEYQTSYEEIEKSSTMYSLRVVGGGYVHPHIALGVGMGIEGNSGYIRTATPFFIDARFYFINMYGNTEGSTFIYTDFGVFHKWNANFEKGTMFEIGGGYESEGVALTIGYNYRRLDDWGAYLDVHSFTAAVSYSF